MRVAQRIPTEEIYDALLEEDGLTALSGRLADAIGARSWIVGWIYDSGLHLFPSSTPQWPEAMIAEYARDFARLDLWTQAFARNLAPERVIDAESLVPPGLWENGVVYNELLRPHREELFHCVSIAAANRTGKGCIAFHRLKSQSRFGRDSIAMLEEAAPHVSRTLSLKAKMLSLDVKARSADIMLETLGDAAFVLSPNRRIVELNEAAEQLLSAGSALRQRGGILEARQATANAALRRAVGAASARERPEATSFLLDGGRALAATAIPLRLPGRAGAVLLWLRDLADRRPGVADQLRGLFGLTVAEARIAEAIGDGKSATAIAEERQVTHETVRGQIKSLMAKLGCRRQAEVAKIVARLIRAP